MRLWLGFAVFSTLGLVVGCGGGDDEGEEKKTFAYPRDDVLRLNQVQAKGSHNSYHIETPGMTIAALKYTHAPLDVQLEEQGVRKFELDVSFNSTTEELDVFHLAVIDKVTSCPTLVACLKTIEGWSRAHPAHHPLFIQIEPKDSLPADPEPRFELYHSAILAAFPRDRVLAPDDVKGDAASLREAIVSGGWPTLGEVRGKVLFFVDNSSDFRTAYTRGGTNLDGRLMFVDSDPGAPYEATYVLNDPVVDSAEITAAVSAGFIVRTRADADNTEPFAGDTARRDAAFQSGAQIISTDYPAPVDGVSYVVDVPDGTPSRCNPVSAPAECSSTDIENPEAI